MIEPSQKIFVAGHRGLVGSALMRALHRSGYTNIITASHQALDLTRQAAVEAFMQQEKPEVVFLAAAKVGGIYANSHFPAEFIYQNLMIQSHVIEAAYQTGVKHLLFLGSSCIYPKHCDQPMREEYLLSGLLEPTNQPYAVAKISGIEQCLAYNKQYGTQYVAVMPTNLYGPGDNDDPLQSHVIPGLLRRFHEAKIQNLPTVEIWGTGTPYREFLHADDLAEACLFLMEQPDERLMQYPLINIGSGQEVSIRELAEMIQHIVQYRGNMVFNPQKPDGTPRKWVDSSKIQALGWKPARALYAGLKQTYLASF